MKIVACFGDVFAAGDELLFVASSDAEARIKTIEESLAALG